MNAEVGTWHVVPISRIVVDDQARKEFSGIEDLARSIEQNGLINPLSVDKDCHLVAGERRLRALKLLGREEVPVIVVPAQKRRAIQLAENADRKGLTASELEAARRAREAELAEQVKAGEVKLPAGKTVKAVVAEELVRSGEAESVTDVERKSRIVQQGVPELVAAVDAGAVSVGAASELIHLPPKVQAKVAKQGGKAAAAKAAEVRAERKAKKGKAAETAEELDGHVDGAEQFCEQLKALCRELDAIGQRIEGLKDSPFARFVHWQSARVQVKNGRETLWQGQPSHECPYCKYAGEVSDRCRCCGGTGVCTKSSHKAGTDAVGGGAE